jgi:hypothetical protein
MKTEFFRQVFANNSNIKFHKNSSSGIRVVSSGRADITTLIVTFGNFAEAPKMTQAIDLQVCQPLNEKLRDQPNKIAAFRRSYLTAGKIFLI